jgi:5-methylcytosine-specific restriction endonuclease McrA
MTLTRTGTINKKEFKQVAGKCRICERPGSELLDVHRIVPGEDGGKYTQNNSVAICMICHGKIHRTKEIVIDRYYPSTAGYLLRIVENGVERFV